MHFDFTVNLGQLVLFVAGIVAIGRTEALLSWFIAEHEMLIDDYCERKGIKKDKLMSRLRVMPTFKDWFFHGGR